MDVIRRPVASMGVWRSGEKDMFTAFMVEVSDRSAATLLHVHVFVPKFCEWVRV